MKAKKQLGQNFLKNADTLAKIIKAAAVEKDDLVIEVGPGKGVLTTELIQQAKKVIAIEKDSELLPFLAEKFASASNLELVEADILKTPPPNEDYKVVANIPYYITSPILNHFLQAANKPQSMTLLVQKEVAEKICTKAGKHSILSLQVQLFGEPSIIAKVPASHFVPAPKVDSAILQIDVFEKEKYKNPLKILKLAKMAFSQKRKKLRNTLGNYIKTDRIDMNRRPQTLSLEEWALLTELKNINP